MLNFLIFWQLAVFIFLIFVPGFLILKLLNIKKIKIVDEILFSIGLSIAFVMFFGFSINELYLILGISEPLSIIPLGISLTFFISFLFFYVYRRDFSHPLFSLKRKFKFSRASFIGVGIISLSVVLSVIGALTITNYYISFPIFVGMFLLIVILFALSSQNKFISSDLYPYLIFAISLALCLHILLISRYIIGTDAHLEYYVFRISVLKGSWGLLPIDIQPTAIVNYNAMLSITILPAFYSILMNVKGEILFKILYPFIFSLIPVVLFRVYENQIGKSNSLLSTIFFISSPLVFYGTEFLTLNRQIVAELFLVLAVFVLLNKNIQLTKRRVLLIIFGVALAVSHYSIGYIFLGIISLLFVYQKIKHKSQDEKVLNIPTVSILVVFSFLWYIFSASPILSLLQLFNGISSRFITDFDNPAARSSTVFTEHPVLSFASATNWALFYAVHALIAVGIIVLFFKASRTKIDPIYRIIMIVNVFLLSICVLIPNFAPAFNFTRFYAITMIFLAPCFVIGGHSIIDAIAYIFKKKENSPYLRYQNLNIRLKKISKITSITLSILLIAYFLSQSGFLNAVTNADPLSVALDYNEINSEYSSAHYKAFISEPNLVGALWLSSHNDNSSLLFADYVSSFNILDNYGPYPIQEIHLLNNWTVIDQKSVIFLGQINVLDGLITTYNQPFNISEISHIMDNSSLLYSNGNTEILYAYPFD